MSLKILISTPTFLPEVGGLELLTDYLARRFTDLGNTVRLVTKSRDDAEADAAASYEIVRNPGILRSLELARWADVHLQTQLTLTFGWMHLFVGTPLVMGHQNRTPRVGLKGHLKHWQMRRGCNVACSAAIAASLPVAATVIGNPYAEEVFPVVPTGGDREEDFLFVGRLIEDKGAADLVAALGLLKDRGLAFSASIIGGGGERDRLERQVAQAELSAQVRFLGERSPRETSIAMRAHKVLVVPSRWEEPFGIVALEGLASGCTVVVTRVGGLADAAGPSGLKVPKGDPAALADCLAGLLVSNAPAADEAARRAHLSAHTVAAVAGRYLEVLTKAAAMDPSRA